MARAALCPQCLGLRCPSVLRACPLCLAEENEDSCPEGFELDTQGEFCVGECPPHMVAWMGESLQSGWATCPSQLSGGSVSVDHQISPRPPPQTGMSALTAPAPAPIPVTMHLAASPAPVRLASPWPGTAGAAEVSGPPEERLSLHLALVCAGVLGPRPLPGAHTL